MARILVIRFSAIGDVAMVVPVISSLAEQYPQHEFVVLSQQFLHPLFGQTPPNVIFYGVKPTDYKRMKDLTRLYTELQSLRFDYVADLHNVLRSKYLRLRFALSGACVRHIKKGRTGKWRRVRRWFKVRKPLKSSFERYAQVFSALGFPVRLNFTSIYGTAKAPFAGIERFAGVKEKGVRWIGIAPFAKHKGKIYPLELQEKVIAHFAGRPQYKIFLFGGGKQEIAIFNSWIRKYEGVVSAAGRLDLQTELALISHLDVMLAMDSANMHFASIVGTPTISIWGATHPYTGFMGWEQSISYTLQVEMDCRPCSVFGQKPCRRKNYACLYRITPEEIIGKIETVLHAP
ncbi:MAG: glycosyltransferase family 9 protein [Mediterranea sp.]|jgi:ADP-heptose:LPS heptosyltransferase|nr:glycosyltransferase family 9 protein [Mediterranea sp.]